MSPRLTVHAGDGQAQLVVSDAAFLLTLRDSGVRFAAVDLPKANDLSWA